LSDAASLLPFVSQVHEGDCIAGMASLPSGCIDLAFADPPFNIGYKYDVYDDRLEAEHYVDWSTQWMTQVHRVLKPTGAFWLAIGDEYAAELKVAATKIGFHCRSWVIWYYTFGVHCKLKFTRSHAHLFHFVKDPKKFTFNHADIKVPSARQLVYGDRRANSTGRIPDDTWILRPQDLASGFTPDEDVWYFSRVAGTFKERAGFHGCQMPEQLLGRIIRASSSPGEVVMDPFSGSSTTVAVAKKLNRAWLSFELSPDYATLGRERLANIQPGDALVGPEDARSSAPSTNEGRSLFDKVSLIPKKRKGRVTDDASLFATLTDDRFDDVIVDAFVTVAAGHSVDRVLADLVLAKRFHEACVNLGSQRSPREHNHALLTVRHDGRITAAQIDVTEATIMTWRDIEAFRFAGEIAFRQLTDEHPHATLEQLLCDPDLAIQFDELAMRQSPGYRSLDYRWAAIMLRRSRVAAIIKPLDLDAADPLSSESLCKLSGPDAAPWNATPQNSGCYAIIGDDERVLFIDEVANLSVRMKQHFGNESTLAPWIQRFGELTIRWATHPDAGGPRQAFANHLIDRHTPRLN